MQKYRRVHKLSSTALPLRTLIPRPFHTAAHAHLGFWFSHVYRSARVLLCAPVDVCVVFAGCSGSQWRFCRVRRMSDNDDIEVDSDVGDGASGELFPCVIRPQCVINTARASS